MWGLRRTELCLCYLYEYFGSFQTFESDLCSRGERQFSHFRALKHNGVAADSALSAFKGYLKVNTHQFQNPHWASFLPLMYAVCHLNGRRKARPVGQVFFHAGQQTSRALCASKPSPTQQSLVFWVLFWTRSAVIFIYFFSCCILSLHVTKRSCHYQKSSRVFVGLFPIGRSSSSLW